MKTKFTVLLKRENLNDLVLVDKLAAVYQPELPFLSVLLNDACEIHFGVFNFVVSARRKTLEAILGAENALKAQKERTLEQSSLFLSE